MRQTVSTHAWSGLLAVVVATTMAAAEPGFVEAVQAQGELAESALLDVGIVVFAPGLPEEDESALEEEGVYPDVRKSEARYLAYHLKETLQATGYWGAVRVLPHDGGTVDLTVTGEIVRSDGRVLAVRIRPEDARGREWFDRKYKDKADPRAYADEEIGPRDPYQSLYNEIANDLLKRRLKLDQDELDTIRTVAKLRFAAEVAPDAFAGYLEKDRRGRFEIVRLPADDDPMMERVERIRLRDHMFVDTLDEYYSDFYLRMHEPYGDWRAFSHQEQVALAKMKRRSTMLMVLGGLLVAGAAVADDDSDLEEAAREAAAVGGAVAIQAGVNERKEAKMHREALRELVASFDSEIRPVLVEVEGQTLRLTGSAEAQYAAWRELLRDLFAAETGLPLPGAVTAERSAADVAR